MSNQYGPWATPINIGPNPQLSAFWKRRLTMLVPTSQTSPVLSRRNLVCLVVAGAMMIVLPTFRVGAAAAEDEKPATIRKENAPSSVQEKGPRSKEQMSSEQPAKRDQAKAKEKTSAEAQAAERAYEATVNAYETGDADIEAVYRWSCRWMQAERAERGDAAIKSHLDRMQTFYNKIAELNEIGAKGGEEVKLAAARYYMVEAKEMLKQAKAAPAGHSDVPAAGQPAPVSAGNNEKESASDGALKAVVKEQAIRDRAIEELQKAGAEVRLGPGDKIFSVNFNGKPVGDQVVSLIGRLSDTRMVDLAHTNVSDAGLAALSSLSNLEWLMLTETGITDAGVNQICEHKTLWHLNLGGTKITDDAIPELAKLPRLSELMITSNPRITDLSLERLTPLKSLKTLYLNATRVTDDGLRHLKELPNLQTIGLYMTDITDEGVQRLVQIRSLRHIELNDTRITTATLDRLGTMPNLEHLEVSSNRGVSKTAVEAFKKAHPRCTVEAYGQMGP